MGSRQKDGCQQRHFWKISTVGGDSWLGKGRRASLKPMRTYLPNVRVGKNLWSFNRFFSGGILFNLDHDLEKGIQGWQYAMPYFLQLHPHNLQGKGSQAAHFEAFWEGNLLETQNESPENNLTLQNN